MEKLFFSLKLPSSELKQITSNTSKTDFTDNVVTTSDDDLVSSTKKRENSQHPPFPAPAKLITECKKTDTAPHMQEGQGDAVIKTDDCPAEFDTDVSSEKGMTRPTHTGIRSEEDWIMISENSSETDTQIEIGQGCYVVPASTSSSSFLDVTSVTSPFQAEPSPQISSTSISRTSIISSYSCSDEDRDQCVRAARPSRATDRFDTGPWIAEDDYQDSPAVPIPTQYFDYDNHHPCCRTDENYLKNGYQSPVSDDETFFSCREDLSKKSEEILTNISISGDDESYASGSKCKINESPRKKSSQVGDKNIKTNESLTENRYNTSVSDELAIQEASFELADQVLNMSLNAFDASTPSENVMALTFNSNTMANADESGFHDGELTSSKHHVFNPCERPVLSVNRTVDIHFEVKETPEENPISIGDSMLCNDSIRMKILSETPMSDDVSMELCNTPARLDQSQRSEDKIPSFQIGYQRILNQQRQLMTITDKEQQNMEAMLREAKRAHDEFEILRKTVDKVIQRIAELES